MINKVRRFCISALLLVLHSGAVSSEPQKIILATFDQKAPRLTASEIIVQKIYNKLDIVLEVVKHPGNRSLVMANKAQVDGVLVRADLIEGLAENLVKIPYPIAHVKYSAYAKKSKLIKIDGWASLNPYRVGVLRGVKLIEERTKGLNQIKNNNFKALFKVLYLDRIDVAIFTELDGLYALKAMNLHNEIQKLEPVLEVSPAYHFLHKKHSNLIKEMTSLMKQMNESGELEALIHQSEMTVINTLP